MIADAMMAKEINRYRAAHAALAPALPGDELIASFRSDALDRFAQAGFPGARSEDWKYTNVRPIVKRQFEPARALVEPELAQEIDKVALFGKAVDDEAANNALRVVLVNGHYSAGLSKASTRPDGLTISNLATLMDENPHRFHRRFLLDGFHPAHGFTALADAFSGHGVVIDIEPGADIKQPIYLLSYSTGTGLVLHPRVIINAGINSRAVVIEHYAGHEDSANFNNSVTQIQLSGGAALEHYRVQDESRKSFHIGGVYVRQCHDSRFVSHNIALGAALARTDLQTQLLETGAEIIMNGLYVLDGRQHIDNHTRVEHIATHTRSEQDYRGVINDRARAVFNGKVKVHQDAQKTDARQSNRNLLLSGQAEIDTKPELEIYADDIKCSHGATVGQLDEDALFYLLSRGIDRDTAKGLLIFAFAADVIARIGIDAVRQRLEQVVIGRLPDADMIRQFTANDGSTATKAQE